MDLGERGLGEAGDVGVLEREDEELGIWGTAGRVGQIHTQRSVAGRGEAEITILIKQKADVKCNVGRYVLTPLFLINKYL
jgi:hypothetical protein